MIATLLHHKIGTANMVAHMVVFLVANVFQNHGKHEEMMLERSFFFHNLSKKLEFVFKTIEEHLEKKPQFGHLSPINARTF